MNTLMLVEVEYPKVSTLSGVTRVAISSRTRISIRSQPAGAHCDIQ